MRDFKAPGVFVTEKSARFGHKKKVTNIDNDFLKIPDYQLFMASDSEFHIIDGELYVKKIRYDL